MKAVLVAMALLGLSRQGPCLTLYRYDLMEKWEVKNGSALCGIKSHVPKHADHYTLAVNNESALIVQSEDYSREFDSNWISEKGKHEYSVSLIRQGVSYPHFMTIVETDDRNLTGSYEHVALEGINSVRRSIYYVEKEDIETIGATGRKIIWTVLCTIFGVFAILAVISRVMNFALPIMVVMTVAISLITGMWLITTYWGVLVMVACVFIVALIAAIINWKLLRALGSACFGLVMIVYYFIGSPYEYMYGFPFAFVLLFLVSAIFAYYMPGMMMGKKLKFTVLHFSFWMCQYLFWSYIFYVYPAELYLRLRSGPRYYKLGVQGLGIVVYWPMILTFVLVFCLSLLSGCIAKSRLHRSGYGPDSAQGDTRPLI